MTTLEARQLIQEGWKLKASGANEFFLCHEGTIFVKHLSRGIYKNLLKPQRKMLPLAKPEPKIKQQWVHFGERRGFDISTICGKHDHLGAFHEYGLVTNIKNNVTCKHCIECLKEQSCVGK